MENLQRPGEPSGQGEPGAGVEPGTGGKPGTGAEQLKKTETVLETFPRIDILCLQVHTAGNCSCTVQCTVYCSYCTFVQATTYWRFVIV